MTPVEAQEAWGRVHGQWEACVEERASMGPLDLGQGGGQVGLSLTQALLSCNS